MPVLEIKEASYRYLPGEPLALEAINLVVEEGEFLGVMGATGAGKSSLLQMLGGAIPLFHTSGVLTGSVRLRGREVREHSFKELAADVGTVLQDPEAQIFNLYVQDELTWGAQNMGLPADEIRERADRWARAFRIDALLERMTHSLSGGQKQLLTLAAILMMGPNILLLDEPTSELDPRGTALFFSTLRDLLVQQNLTVVLASHKAHFLAAHADRIVLLANGRIHKVGTPLEVLSDVEALLYCGYEPPHVIELFLRLSEYTNGSGPFPLSFEEGLAWTRAFLLQHRYEPIELPSEKGA